MTDVYSDRLGLIAQDPGTHTNEWGALLNLDIQRLDSSIRGYTSVALAGTPKTLDATDITTTSVTAQENSFFAFIEFTGTGGSTVTVPAENIVWRVYNNSDATVTFTPLGGTGVVLAVGKFHTIVYGSNGTTFTDVTSLALVNAAITGTSTFTGTVNSVTTTEFAMLSGRTLASTDDVIDNFPAGTSMLFRQTTAPTGWSNNPSYNDHCLKVTTGIASNGGTTFFTNFMADSTTGGTAISSLQMPSHLHSINHDHASVNTSTGGAHTHTFPVYGDDHPNAVQARSGSGGLSGNEVTSGASTNHNHTVDLPNFSGSSGFTGNGDTHTHSLSQDIKYVDVILAEKD